MIGLAVLGLWLFARREAAPAATPAPSTLPTVALPDLDALQPGAQQQIEVAHEALQTLLEADSAEPAALGEAYGTLGLQLLAYDEPGAPLALQQAALLQSEDPRWPYFSGIAERRRGNLEAAAAAFQRAASLDAGDPLPRVRAADALIELGRQADAARLLDEALALNPSLGRAHELSGRIALDREDWAAAIEHFEAALRLQPAALAIHGPLAEAYRKSGQPDAAARHLDQLGAHQTVIVGPYERLLEELNRGTELRITQADEALRAGKASEAIAIYEAVVADQPESTRAMINLGVARRELGDMEGAMEAFRQAIALDPTDAHPQVLLGSGLVRTGRVAEAEAAFREAARIDPRHFRAWYNLAELLSRTDRCAEAVAAFDAAIGITPDHGASHVRRAMCLARIGRAAEALAGLELAQEGFAAPEVTEALVRLLAAAPEDSLREGRRALTLARSLAEQRPREPGAIEALAMALAEVGQWDEAVRRQGEAIALAEGNASAERLSAMRAILARFTRGEPSREPWPAWQFTLAAAEG